MSSCFLVGLALLFQFFFLLLTALHEFHLDVFLVLRFMCNLLFKVYWGFVFSPIEELKLSEGDQVRTFFSLFACFRSVHRKQWPPRLAQAGELVCGPLKCWPEHPTACILGPLGPASSHPSPEPPPPSSSALPSKAWNCPKAQEYPGHFWKPLHVHVEGWMAADPRPKS